MRDVWNLTQSMTAYNLHDFIDLSFWFRVVSLLSATWVRTGQWLEWVKTIRMRSLSLVIGFYREIVSKLFFFVLITNCWPHCATELCSLQTTNARFSVAWFDLVVRIRVVSSEISSGIFLEISGKITVLYRNNSAEKRTCQTPSYFRTMSTFWNVF